MTLATGEDLKRVDVNMTHSLDEAKSAIDKYMTASFAQLDAAMKEKTKKIQEAARTLLETSQAQFAALHWS